MPINLMKTDPAAHTEIGRRRFLSRSAATLAAATAAAEPLTPGPAAAQTPSASPEQTDFFPGFKREQVRTSGTTINVVHGGSGPPVLLLHGYPETHVMWQRVAPRLAGAFTLVIPDLRGYGDSGKPADGDNHAGHSKRAMAQDQVEVMEALGFRRFAVVGHDRGARVGHRMALDHADRVARLALLDILPTLYLYRNADRRFASAYWHWFFLIQPAPFPEEMIGGRPETFLRRFIGQLVPASVGPDAYAEYLRHFSDPAAVHATCEDYRAGASIDLEHDEADLDRRVQCPVLVLWGGKGAMGRLYDVLRVWTDRAETVSGKALPCGHFMPEELPEPTATELSAFLGA